MPAVAEPPAQTTAAPAAQTPAPSPAPAESRPAAPPEPSPSGGADPFDDLDAKLTARFGEPSKPAEKAAPEKKEPAAKPEAPKPGEKPAEKPAASTGGPKELRAELERVKNEHRSAQEKVAEYEKKLAEAEAKGKDTTALSEKLAKAEAAQEQLRSELRAARREVSPDFKEKHDKPFNDAAEYAKRDIEQLSITEGSEDEGNQTERAAKWEDFIGLYRLPKGKAIAEARKLFGAEQAGVVISHLTELQKLDYTRAQALEAEKAGWAEREKDETAKAAQEKEAVSAMWRKVNDDLKAKRPEWFGDDPADEEGNKLLAEGYKLVDAAFSNRGALTPQQRVVLDAQVRNRAAAFPRLIHRLAGKDSRITELESKLAELEGSKPGETRKPGGKDTKPDPNEARDLATELREAVAT